MLGCLPALGPSTPGRAERPRPKHNRRRGAGDIAARSWPGESQAGPNVERKGKEDRAEPRERESRPSDKLEAFL